MWWWVWGFSSSPLTPSHLLLPAVTWLPITDTSSPSLLDHQRKGNYREGHTQVEGAASHCHLWRWLRANLPSALSSRVYIPLSWGHPPPPSPHKHSWEYGMERKSTPPYFSIYFQTSGQLRLSLSWQSIRGSSATTCGQEAVFTQKWEVPLRREAIFPVRRDHFLGGDSECEGCHPKSRACPGCQWDNDLILGEREHSGERERASF